MSASVPSHHVIIVDGPDTITGTGTIVPTPPSGDPVELFDRLGRCFGGDGLVLLTDRGLALYEATTAHPGVLYEAGWQVSKGEVWRTARRAGSYIRFGFLPEINRENDPLVDDNPVTTAILHETFHRLTGVPFYGDGGSTSGILMDATISVRGRPLLRKWDNDKFPAVRETPWLGPWETGEHGTVHVDRNAQYLSAAGGAILPLDALTHDVTTPARPCPGPDETVGLYQIMVPANPEPRLPHPCGAGAPAGRLAWVASPTLGLLSELGIEPEIAASWTVPKDRARRVLHGPGRWYERLRDARASLLNEPGDMAAVLRAVKDTYSRGVSHLGRHTGRWYRPDWVAIIHAQARTAMWRSLWNVGKGEGVWPVEVRTDAATYATLPETLRVGTGMGEWKIA